MIVINIYFHHGSITINLINYFDSISYVNLFINYKFVVETISWISLINKIHNHKLARYDLSIHQSPKKRINSTLDIYQLTYKMLEIRAVIGSHIDSLKL